MKCSNLNNKERVCIMQWLKIYRAAHEHINSDLDQLNLVIIYQAEFNSNWAILN